MKPMMIAAAALAAAALAGPAAAQVDAAKATAALNKGACTACHAVDKKMVGPAYKDVAKKYKGDAKAPDMLAEKVRKGGAGNWGPVPMPPNGPDKISDDDLKMVIAWIMAQ